MAKNDSKVTDNPKLKEKLLSDGQMSLYLEYYLGYTPVYNEETDTKSVKIERKKESLNLYIWASPRTPLERQTNKETLELARKIRNEREQELKEGKLGYRLKAKDINFFDYLQAYYDEYTKADKRMIKAAKKRFIDFVALEYPLFKNNLPPDKITSDMMEAFVEYLQNTSKGEGAVTHWKRWKKIIKSAVKKDVLRKNPCEDVVCKADEGALKKDILSQEEMMQLIHTTYPGQNQHTRKAFIFTLYTGIRFCDIKELRYGNVDYSNKILTFNQRKTQGNSSKSYVNIPLNDDLLSLIGTPPINDEGEVMDDLLFHLPSQDMCLKALRHWTKKAGIPKHITWHCGRHSFAVNILNNGANIKTIASLLGHSGLKHTEKYTRAVDSLKEAAINSLPALKI